MGPVGQTLPSWEQRSHPQAPVSRPARVGLALGPGCRVLRARRRAAGQGSGQCCKAGRACPIAALPKPASSAWLGSYFEPSKLLRPCKTMLSALLHLTTRGLQLRTGILESPGSDQAVTPWGNSWPPRSLFLHQCDDEETRLASPQRGPSKAHLMEVTPHPLGPRVMCHTDRGAREAGP